jgi:hypothetical protein
LYSDYWFWVLIIFIFLTHVREKVNNNEIFGQIKISVENQGNEMKKNFLTGK